MNRRFKGVAMVLVMAVSMSAAATPAHAETIMGACLDAAAVRANNCYVNADGSWFLGRLCDYRWEFDDIVCYIIGVMTGFQ